MPAALFSPANLRAALRGRARPAPRRCGLCPRGALLPAGKTPSQATVGKGGRRGRKYPSKAGVWPVWDELAVARGRTAGAGRGAGTARHRERSAGSALCVSSLTLRHRDCQKSSGQRGWFLGNARNNNVNGKKRVRKSLGKRFVCVSQSVAVPRQL